MAEAKATFGAGCFWGVEDTFRKVDGVLDAVSGYEGGTKENPTYQEVCSGQTGHAEVVEVTYDPDQVAYADLLKVFWDVHDPTQVDRQGPDVGRQYRSVIFAHDDAQRDEAARQKDELDRAGRFGRPIATAIEPHTRFWRAEEYHQRYFEKAMREHSRV